MSPSSEYPDVLAVTASVYMLSDRVSDKKSERVIAVSGSVNSFDDWISGIIFSTRFPSGPYNPIKMSADSTRFSFALEEDVDRALSLYVGVDRSAGANFSEIVLVLFLWQGSLVSEHPKEKRIIIISVIIDAMPQADLK